MIRTSVKLMKNEKFIGNAYFDGMVDFDRVDTADHFCDYLKDHIDDLIISYRRVDHEANED